MAVSTISAALPPCLSLYGNNNGGVDINTVLVKTPLAFVYEIGRRSFGRPWKRSYLSMCACGDISIASSYSHALIIGIQHIERSSAVGSEG